EGQRTRQFHDLPLAHCSGLFQRFFLARLAKNDLEDFVETNGGNKQPLCILYSRREEAGVRAAREILQPRRRIDDVHKRSAFSRKPSVFSPLSDPRRDLMSFTGTNSRQPSYSTTSNFWPGLIPICLRMFSGITT